jgi:IS5 family transposase
VLSALVVKYPSPSCRCNKHLCADAVYSGAPAAAVMAREGYLPHVRSRTQEVRQYMRHPRRRAHRWIVEVAHSWFNRFRKLLVRYEKLERSFIALNHLAAAIIVRRKVPMKINIIYG